MENPINNTEVKCIGSPTVCLPLPKNRMVIEVTNRDMFAIKVCGQGIKTAKIPVGRKIIYKAKNKKQICLWRAVRAISV